MRTGRRRGCARRRPDMRIVIIDDNRDDRALAARALRQALPGVEIVEAWTRESLDTALAVRPGAVVTDYALPDPDGIQVLVQVKRRHAGVPVVMFTNTGSEEIAAS